jgi:hypothetical protein
MCVFVCAFACVHVGTSVCVLHAQECMCLCVCVSYPRARVCVSNTCKSNTRVKHTRVKHTRVRVKHMQVSILVVACQTHVKHMCLHVKHMSSNTCQTHLRVKHMQASILVVVHIDALIPPPQTHASEHLSCAHRRPHPSSNPNPSSLLQPKSLIPPPTQIPRPKLSRPKGHRTAKGTKFRITCPRGAWLWFRLGISLGFSSGYRQRVQCRNTSPRPPRLAAANQRAADVLPRAENSSTPYYSRA